MIEVCNCADGQTIQNFGGFGDCIDGVGVPINAVLMSDTKLDGSANGIEVGTDVLNAAFFNGKFKDEVVENRWLFLEGVTDFDSPVVDPNTEELDDGRIFQLSDNSKEVTFSIVTSEAHKLAAKIKASECRGLSIMYDDDLKNLVGDLRGTTFTGRKIQRGSLNVQVIDKTNTTVSRVQVKFKYDRSALETAVNYIKDSSLTDFSVRTDATALIDARIEILTSTLTELTFTIKSDAGGVESRIGLGGLDETHLEAYNRTGTTTVAWTVTEGALGVYTGTYGAPIIAAQDMEVRGITQLYVQKDYDLKALKDVFKVSA